MNAAELLDDLSVRIYEPPLANLRDDGRILDTSNPLSVVMLVIDYETECSMNGIIGYLGNSAGERITETISALRVIGCSAHADKLTAIQVAATNGGMTHADIQTDREQVAPFAVTSFAELHGDKWDSTCDTINSIFDGIDCDELWPKMTEFIQAHMGEIEHQL